MISVIDYGGGNTKSVSNILQRCKINHVVTHDHNEIKKSNRIILPGVANFSFCMKQLRNKGLDEIIKEEVVTRKKKFLGICSGMQLLGSFSEEGNLDGLNLIPGQIKKLKKEKCKIIPHMGWNKIIHKDNVLLKNIDNNSRFYFCHSYYFHLEDENNSMIKTNYGFNFCVGVNKGNIYGIQFHPEKSLSLGKTLINNFANI